jgi:hypothetical protein
MSAEILTSEVVKNRRSRRTNDQLAALDEQLIVVLKECQPQSVRHVYYRMTDTRLAVSVPKTDKGPGNGYSAVQRRLSKLRENGRIPYAWVCDFTRRGYHVATYSGAADFIRRAAGLYRANAWEVAETYVEVWVESRSIAGVVEDLCYELAVSLYPSGGFTSHSMVFDCSGYIEDKIAKTGKAINVIYIGDFDPSGVLIDQDIEKRLRKHLDARGIDPDQLTFHRIAVIADQVVEHNLPTKPRKPKERRSNEIIWTVEAEALPVPVLLRLLREKIESFMPVNAIRVAKAAEDSEKQLLRIFASAFEEGGRAPP